MRGLKRGIAFAMASTMLLGSGISASATAGTSVTGDGHYTQENIEETISVVFPTVPEGATPFDYVMDPEGNVPKLVASGAAVYGDDIDVENLPGLYYVTGTGLNDDGEEVPEFSANSESVKVTNMSACDVAIGVSFEVTEFDYNTARILGVNEIDGNNDKNQLALSLYAGDGEEALSSVFIPGEEEGVYVVNEDTRWTRMRGNPENFVLGINEEAEEDDIVCAYSPKPGIDSWPAADFYMSGEISNFRDPLPGVLVRPQVTVTWTYLRESEYDGDFGELPVLATYNDAADPFIDGNIFAADEVEVGEALVVTFNKGASEGITKLEYSADEGETWNPISSNVEYNNEAGTITFAAAYVDAFRGNHMSRTWRATFAPIGDDDPVSDEFEIVSWTN